MLTLSTESFIRFAMSTNETTAAVIDSGSIGTCNEGGYSFGEIESLATGAIVFKHRLGARHDH